MRLAGMLMLAAIAVPAIVGSRADAAFTELSYARLLTQLSTGEQVMRYRVYANFSSDQDRVVGVHCGIGQATKQPFFHSPFGTWTEPPEALFPVFPDLALITFVTIGLPSLQPGQPATVIAPGSTFAAAEFQAGWSAPVDAPYTHGPSVLIAQLTVPGLNGVEVEIALEWVDASGQRHESCMSMVLYWDIEIPCEWPHRADFNHDCVVNGFDLAILLGFWGVNEECGVFGFPWDCPGDLTCGPSVDRADLGELLAEWGSVEHCQLGR